MRTFDFRHAVSVDDAIRSAAETGGAYLAGGTNLVDLMKNGVLQPPALVDIRRLGLTEVASTEAGGVRIGAGVSNSALANHPLVRSRYPVLSQAILSGATTQLRNMATVGGNLLQRTRCPYFMQTEFDRCNKRVPDSGCAALDGFNREHALFGTSSHCVATNPSDMAVALTILDAVVHVQGPGGSRSIPIAEFFTVPGDTPQRENCLQPAELITAIELPPSPYAAHSWYLKLRDRHSYAFALVSAAVGIEVSGGVIVSGAVALGGVAPMPWRVPAAEAVLIGRPPEDTVLRAAAEQALSGARPLNQNGFKIPLGRSAVHRALVRGLDSVDTAVHQG
ncbi:xanthine dehydrogenase family protein subunit M [Mycobacterium crocinum]|uniref:Xanthine dehydrogenase family protein subunit M n=1 Tax=Mycolicibacterium crocinum TaxID=388459 RepID=A0ABY3TIE8_9MYCO|nr:xanthine dehydrogenase family protein subunit M [Mycolicibacterium crocinum]MCV7217983.1 xanthine dehydrogenase family protein subunit M [Mycolicibacterium crocinum]ULN39641.1 xanthine dehydrogenase family protein subunit M [Mycolicibacterium crocinum]